MIKRILVGIADPAYTASATRHAVEIARRCGAALTGVSIFDLARFRKDAPSLQLGGGFTAASKASTIHDAAKTIDESVDVFVRLSQDAHVAFEFQKVTGEPFAEFIERSKYQDITVCGLRQLFEHGALPEPKDELARLLAAGVRPILAVASPQRIIKKVLVAYSHSVESAATLRHFTHLRQAIAPEAAVEIVSFGKAGSDAPAHLIEARNYMQAHGIEPELKFIEGSPRKGVLARAGDTETDLIVMGNSAKGLLRRQVFGETALHTIEHAHVPLFLSQ